MIEALSIFIAVADAGSFSKVAKSRGVAVSSITRRIDTLEAEVGARLLHRSSQKITLTDAGGTVLVSARHILAELQDVKDAVADMHAEPRGLLTVTAPSMFGRQYVLPAVTTFLSRYPGITVDLLLSDEVLDLSSRRADVAIRQSKLPESDLVASKLAPVHRLVCASPAYLAQHGTPTRPEDLLRHNCLTTVTMPAPTGWWTFAGFNREQPLPVTGTLRSNDTGALLQASLSDMGVVHLASWLVADHIRAGRLVPLLPHLKPPADHRMEIHAVHMPGRSHRIRSRLFATHLRETFGVPPYWDVGLLGMQD